jgi:exportin-1
MAHLEDKLVLTFSLQGMLTDRITTILDFTFEPTLNMINKDFSEFPEHRAGFYNLLREINLQCFPALIPLLPTPQFKLIVDSIVWGFKHTMREIADLGLQICLELLGNFSKTDVDTASEFYRRYYLSILQDVFFVLTDTDHKSGMYCFPAANVSVSM